MPSGSVAATPPVFGKLSFSPDGEEWIEFGGPGARTRVGFHDYEAIYAVPGLYERVFYEELGMTSSQRVVDLLAGALSQDGREPAAERVLDVGAGNGFGGERLRRAGIRSMLGLDLSPGAGAAAARDRPDLYEDYLTADLTALSVDQYDRLARFRPTAVVALSALGFGHAPPAALAAAIAFLPPGGLFAFAVKPVLAPESTDRDGVATGYPAYLTDLFARHIQMARVEYVHRRFANGAADLAVAFAGQVSE